MGNIRSPQRNRNDMQRSGHLSEISVDYNKFYSKKPPRARSEEHTSELQSHSDLVCHLLLEKKKQSEGRCPGDRPLAVANRPTRPAARHCRAGQAGGSNEQTRAGCSAALTRTVARIQSKAVL